MITIATILAGALIVAASVVWAGFLITGEIRERRREETLHHLLALFGPALAASRDDPRHLVAWYPVAATARRLFPDECGRLDGARGQSFPFTADDVQAAHARCTSDWLAWERSHDAEYALKASALEEEIARGPEAGTAVGRARVEAIEREKLERYQRRYEEYVRAAKALQALLETK